jgi:hypothetical protein
MYMIDESSGEEYIANNRISNGYSKPLVLLIEPWYESFTVPPGEHVIVSAKGPIGDGMEIVLNDEVCIVWGWTSSSIVVLHKGEIVIDLRHSKMPATPVTSLRSLGESVWASDR